MKSIFTFALVCILFTTSYSQNNKFKNLDQYSHWVMNYFQKPDTANTYSAFQYGINHKELASTEGKNIMFAFFGALFRKDSTLINKFYTKIKDNQHAHVHNAFVGSLWMANTAYSNAILKEYIASEHGKKFKSDSLEFTIPFDIYNDPITEPAHIDYIWADFFATGNTDNILRIISALRTDSMNSDAAKWSLINNGIQFKEVYEILDYQSKEVSDQYLKKKLLQILAEINKEMKK